MICKRTPLHIFTSLLLIGLFCSLISPQLVFSAPNDVDASNFNPGRIIDDAIFTDTSTMTAEEIQRFLENSVSQGECDRYKENIYSGTTEGPYTCLFEFQQNVETGENNYGLFDDDGAPSEIEDGLTAAEIIWQAAQDHEINPQVLLVLLQKEQSLITDNWPWVQQYAQATGYHCPDTAPCDPASANFHKQVSGAAWQFRIYLDYIDEYWYIIGENRILYNPDASCGYQVVDIENKATVALYLYTPYVPNEAALNNLFGRGDNCSAYGNRNFWVYFNRWFGPTTSSENLNETSSENNPERERKSFTLFFQGLYTDSNKNESLDSQNHIFGPSESIYVVLDIRNTGTQVWTQAEGDNYTSLFSLSTEGNPDRLCHSSWRYDCNLVATMKGEEVYPGDVATFEFEILTSLFNGKSSESFSLKNNSEYLKGDPVSISFNIAGGGDIQDKEDLTTITEEPPTTPSPPAPDPSPIPEEPVETVASNTVILPDNWPDLNVLEKILLNPWGCHDTTQIRADNGQCLSGGYTIPTLVANSPPAPDSSPIPEEPVETVASNTVILPDNWPDLNVLEKILLNPWGCHDTTQIRADNGQCLSGGYTIPTLVANSPPAPDSSPIPEEPVETVASNTVILPDNWPDLNVLEKILLNPWGCHDTTQIRADNGQCLSGGYTIPTLVANSPPAPDSSPIPEEPVETVASNTVILPDNWPDLNVLEKILLNPWGCHDTTQIRADNGQCLSGGYTIPNQIA